MHEPNPLREYFERNPGRLMTKWTHYFDVYHRHFQRFRGMPITMMEIGLYHGGSLQMWREYFGPQAQLVGIDIEQRCMAFAEQGTQVMIGDQSDREFLARVRARFPRVDILLDDGGHRMWEQIATFEELYGTVAEDGVFLCEDLHTSYWKEYGGGLISPFTFIAYSKMLIDRLNAFHSRDRQSLEPDLFTRSTASMHFYDSMLVIEKLPQSGPVERTTGKPMFPLSAHEESHFRGLGWQGS